jgi:hypothetical protein
MLDMYTKQLQESVADYDRISRKALNLTQEFTRPTDVRKSSPGDTSGH